MCNLTIIKVPSITTDLYQMILSIRKTVFVEEQSVPLHLEIDQYEETSTHILAYENDHAVSVGRFRKIDGGYKIERVATLPNSRGKGIATKLMSAIENEIFSISPNTTIYLNAQVSAKSLYTKLGYLPFGDQFDEAGIEHIKMKKSVTHK